MRRPDTARPARPSTPVGRPPQQTGADHALGQVTQQHNSLVQRRALDYHLDYRG